MGRRKSATGSALGAIGLSGSLKHRRSSYVAPGAGAGILQQLSTGVVSGRGGGGICQSGALALPAFLEWLE